MTFRIYLLTEHWPLHRFVKVMYTEEGKGITDRLWRETLDAFEFGVVEGKLDAIAGSNTRGN